MQDAQDFRQAVCESRSSDRIVKFLTGDKFTKAIQALMDNSDVWGAYYERSGALVIEDRSGCKHYNVLADGSARRPVAQVRWLVVDPMSAAQFDIRWKSRKSALDDIEEQRLPSKWVSMTEKQWARYKGQCQKPGLKEDEQRRLVSAIVGYDY